MGNKLAINGGPKAVAGIAGIATNGILTGEDEAAALDVIRNNRFSGTDITEQLQREIRRVARQYAIAYCNNNVADLRHVRHRAGHGRRDHLYHQNLLVVFHRRSSAPPPYSAISTISSMDRTTSSVHHAQNQGYNGGSLFQLSADMDPIMRSPAATTFTSSDVSHKAAYIG